MSWGTSSNESYYPERTIYEPAVNDDKKDSQVHFVNPGPLKDSLIWNQASGFSCEELGAKIGEEICRSGQPASSEVCATIGRMIGSQFCEEHGSKLYRHLKEKYEPEKE